MADRIVVGIDDTVEAWIALHWAIQEALARHCPIRIVHVYDKDRRNVQAEQEILDAAVGIAYQRVGASSTTGALVLGDPIAVLADESAGAALVVVGSRRRRETFAVHLGSVSAGLVGKAKCPVMTVREGSENRHVIVGVKDLTAPDGMLRFAFAEAHDRGRRLSVLHFDLTGTGGATIEQELVDAARTLGGAYPDVDLAIRVLPGDPVAGLIARSAAASLVVVGARVDDTDLTSAERTSQRVLYGAQSSVAVVPEPAKAEQPRAQPSWMFGPSSPSL